jgi:hypothetical protein
MAAVCKQLASARIASSVCSVYTPFDNTLAETINGLVNTDIIHHPEHEPWNNFDEVKYSMLGWVDWLNHCRLLEINGIFRQPNLKRCIMSKLKSLS